MPIRCAGVVTSASNAAVTEPESSSTPARIAVWSSRSDGTAKLVFSIDQCVGMARLRQEHFKRRYVVVPLNQRWNRTKAAQRFGIERPHLVGDARAVIVDPQAAAVGKLTQAVAGEMNFADCLDGRRRRIGRGIPAVIFGTDKYVVNVAENTAAGAGG